VTKGEYLYSFDRETYHEFDKKCYTYEDAIKFAQEKIHKSKFTKCYIGITVEIAIDNFIPECINDYAERVLRDVDEYVYDNYGKCSGTYLGNATTKSMAELNKMVKCTIAEWLIKHQYKPNVFMIEDKGEVFTNE
jgi:hypothetical protein